MAKHYIVIHNINSQGEVIPYPFVYTKKDIKDKATKFFWAISIKDNGRILYKIEMYFKHKKKYRLGDVCFYKGERDLMEGAKDIKCCEELEEIISCSGKKVPELSSDLVDWLKDQAEVNHE